MYNGLLVIATKTGR